MGPGVGTWVGIADAAPVMGWQVGFQDWVQQVSPKTGDTLVGCADPVREEEPGLGEGSGQAGKGSNGAWTVCALGTSACDRELDGGHILSPRPALHNCVREQRASRTPQNLLHTCSTAQPKLVSLSNLCPSCQVPLPMGCPAALLPLLSGGVGTQCTPTESRAQSCSPEGGE